ncbi:hypothetical protein SAMN04488082_11231 [Desulfomicrobium apsheronum]|uniref:Uncharacterized protein n=1 Tax=Desulfomicrobium apsheronum TaxID=52560 RepID=A0A1I3W4C6_9BACT|nr:hypothetical protein SAMN04488082_11231 [Desulfomicrobium apsheronum]
MSELGKWPDFVDKYPIETFAVLSTSQLLRIELNPLANLFHECSQLV